MQRRRLCQYSCSIHDNVVPMAVCTHVLFTLFVTVHLSFPSDRSEHRIHPWDTTDADTQTHRHTHTPHKHKSQMLSSGSQTKKKRVATTSLPAVDRQTPPPERRPLQRHTLVWIRDRCQKFDENLIFNSQDKSDIEVGWFNDSKYYILFFDLAGVLKHVC